MNLAKHNDMLSIMISNGKESAEALDQVFHNHFEEKHSPQDIAAAIRRRITEKV